MNVIHTIDLIATNPQIRDGRPFIVGTTVTVADVAVAKIYQMLDADGIADWFNLSLSQVYSALAYYYEHKPEIDQSIEARRKLAQEMKEKRVGSRHQSLFG
ncbi:MAG: DUF433 domain-containing protein [Chloroflexi bacterium]|nr:DUF433 domain-containing protein [Chloroflexota bacterium]